MLTHAQRKLVTALRSRHGRRASAWFAAEGLRAAAEAVARRPEWVEFLICSTSFLRSEAGRSLADRARGAVSAAVVIELPDTEVEALSATENPQGVLCVLRRPQTGVPEAVSDPFALVLDQVREPGNLGTILRTAWAVGLRAVWLTRGSADPFEAKVVRAGMGAQFSLRLVQSGTLAEVREQLAALGFGPLYLAVPQGGASCFDPGFSLAGAGLAVGNEADGVSDPGLGPHVSIPMPGGAESLNVAQAATVLLVDAVRRGLLGKASDAGPRRGPPPRPATRG